jgi:hypothetical protein
MTPGIESPSSRPPHQPADLLARGRNLVRSQRHRRAVRSPLWQLAGVRRGVCRADSLVLPYGRWKIVRARPRVWSSTCDSA